MGKGDPCAGCCAESPSSLHGRWGNAVKITEVRIKLIEDAAERLLAFCSITLDAAFVVRDMKIIVGPNGPFVAMPSRKLTSHCQGCGCKNPIRANFCNQCGEKVVDHHRSREDDGRPRLYADIAHPINARCREMIQQRIVDEYEAELVRSKEPGYVSRYDDPDEDHRGVRHEGGPHVTKDGRGCEDGQLVPSAEKASSDVQPSTSNQNDTSHAAADDDNDFGAGIL
jgi:stage V sporulation protein G